MPNYSSLKECADDLQKVGRLVVVDTQIDGQLELPCLQQKAFQAKAPAMLFTNVKGSNHPVLINLLANEETNKYIFNQTFDLVREAINLKADPKVFFQKMLKQVWTSPIRYMKLGYTGWTSLPKKVAFRENRFDQIAKASLPKIKCWPQDGGNFVTLPQVFSIEPGSTSVMKSNLGMYRVQIDGNEYTDHEVGLHYQTHRGIGIHHDMALKRTESLPTSIFVGGPPAHWVAAVMPLPEGLSELLFSGLLGGKRFEYTSYKNFTLSNHADFNIVGSISNQTKPEGPFGDHLGYYAKTHNFPVLQVKHVFAKKDAIWPMTVVGRPPQEDSYFGKIIHDLTQDIVSYEVPGIKKLHAVDVAGVHPLLLALGSERYVPYGEKKPRELLTQGNAILGFNQCSLAKYLFIMDQSDVPDLEISDIKSYFQEMLRRIDFRRDLHFYTRHNMDTLDYSCPELNSGSKLLIAAAGKPIRALTDHLPSGIESICRAKVVCPGVLAVEQEAFKTYEDAKKAIDDFLQAHGERLSTFPLVVWVDDADFIAADFDNFLWAVFTRSDPAHDIYGLNESMVTKHWGCEVPMLIDARLKPHMPDVLEYDSSTVDQVEQMIANDKVLKKWI